MQRVINSWQMTDDNGTFLSWNSTLKDGCKLHKLMIILETPTHTISNYTTVMPWYHRRRWLYKKCRDLTDYHFSTSVGILDAGRHTVYLSRESFLKFLKKINAVNRISWDEQPPAFYIHCVSRCVDLLTQT